MEKPGTGKDGYVIVLIDGVCHLCQGLTRFIIQRDSGETFRFASQQSEVGRGLLRRGGLPEELNETVVVIDQEQYYVKSAAALRIARHLPFPWPMFGVFALVPRVLRDKMYGWIAANRYRWFGKDESCLMPTPELRRRFLDMQ